jgi:RNA polymerase sigma factor (sigma-70 family)
VSFTSLKNQELQSFATRLEAFSKDQGFDELLALAQRLETTTAQEKDQVSTLLMAAFRDTISNEAFGLLYELNHEGVLRLIYHNLRRSYYAVDAADVLQEVFFNIYRYPFKFKPERPSAFRNWTYSIIRNTCLKHSRKAQRNRALSLGSTLGGDMDDGMTLELVDEKASTPLEQTASNEDHKNLVGAWTLYLHFYLHAYRCLTPREKRALYLVEVDALPYKEVAAKLDVRVENLKMMIFRARRKVFTIMKRKFVAGQSAVDAKVVSEQVVYGGQS